MAGVTQAVTMKEPKVIAGLALLAFSAIIAFEGIRLSSIPELGLAAALGILGWLLLRQGIRSSSQADNAGHDLRSRWLRFVLVASPALVGAYVIGYFVLMDRHLPPYPHHTRGRFESSFRWAGIERRPLKVAESEPWPFPNITIWNLIYRPLDKVYFRLSPRSVQETEKLLLRGWSW